MKALMLTAGLIFASQAMAIDFSAYEGSYNSRGSWKSADGMEDRWTSTVMFSKEETDEGVVVTMTEELEIYMDDETVTKETTLVFNPVGYRFYDVMMGDEKVGEGFCYDNACQYSIMTEGGYSQENMIFKGRSILRVGSGNEEGERFAWRGVSTKDR